MEAVKYIKATEHDIQLLVDYRLEFTYDVVGTLDPATELTLRKELTQYFREELNRTYVSWLAMVNGRVAATGGMTIRKMLATIANPSGMWGYIVSIYTVPEFRRRGLCKEIMLKLMETGEEMGVRAFDLHATPAGAKVYPGLGFELFPQPTFRRYLDHPR